VNREQSYAALSESLHKVAPEVSLDGVDHDADLLEELELDSMDFLSLVTELHERTGLEIPEADYRHLGSVAATVEYLTVNSSSPA
jgi:acyl carrier protein